MSDTPKQNAPANNATEHSAQAEPAFSAPSFQALPTPATAAPVTNGQGAKPGINAATGDLQAQSTQHNTDSLCPKSKKSILSFYNNSWLFKRIAKKLLWLLIVFWGITIVSFWVIHLAPGSPTDLETTMNPMADANARKKLESIYGLDKPLHIQYVNWVGRLVRLDFGTSMSSDRRPVIQKIGERLPLTLGMNLSALLLTLLIAVPIGVKAATHPGGMFDKGSTLFVYIGFAMPSFWLAMLLMLQFCIHWQLLPISGLVSMNYAQLSALGKFKDLATHLALPIFIYTFGSLAGMSRYMRSAMLEVLQQDYIRTARAKGVAESRVIYRHALRNALLPVITLLGLSVPGLIGGSVIVESIFALPGLGQLFYEAVMARDYQLIMGNLVLGAVLTLAGNLIADFAYALADPRIRNGSASAIGGV
ncbi:ABC transporter permease [Desulfovibrio sp. OttesenSCG-928-F07]|nr:ABC transporter permease [Desulfovibrio sp. OttesenSCG-928-F07]